VAHLDPIGTLAILFLPIGWAKPVPINPMNFRNGSRDAILTSAMGPMSNIA
jgi:Zn-dependent protease